MLRRRLAARADQHLRAAAGLTSIIAEPQDTKRGRGRGLGGSVDDGDPPIRRCSRCIISCFCKMDGDVGGVGEVVVVVVGL